MRKTADTKQQRAILRQCKTARSVRRKFPVGTIVVSQDASEPRPRGVVQRHVPGSNAQGGHLVVRWEDGPFGPTTGRSVAGALEVVAP